MAVVDASSRALAGSIVALSVAQTGTGDSTNTADRGPNQKINATKVRIAVALGATPTCTYQIQVSADGTTFANATYADVATPTTDVSSSFGISTDVLTEKIIKHPTPWRYIKVVLSANTNVTNWIDVVFTDSKRWV